MTDTTPVRRRLLAGAAASALAAFAMPAAAQMPAGGNVAAGAVDTSVALGGLAGALGGVGSASTPIAADPAATAFTMRVGSGSAVIDWAGFDIAGGRTVTFENSNGGAPFSVLNRINGGAVTTIAGNLRGDAAADPGSRGTIFVVNESGITFTDSARVTNLSGFIASSLGVTDAAFDAFAAGGTRFSGGGAAPILVQSGASITSGGVLLMVAPRLAVDGAAEAAGHAGFVVAQNATVQLTAGSLLNVRIDAGTTVGADSLVIGGTVSGQRVYAAAVSAADVAAALLNVSGAITATEAVATPNGIVLVANRGVADAGVTVAAAERAGGISLGATAALNADSGTAKGAVIAATGDVTAAAGAAIAAGGGITADSSRAVGPAGDVSLNGLFTGPLTLAGQAVTVSSDGALTAARATARGGALSLTGATVTLGGDLPAALTAAASLAVNATGVGPGEGSISAGAGGATLRSNSGDVDDAAERGLALNAAGGIGATGGAINLAAGAAGGAGGRLIAVDAGPGEAVTLGGVTGGSFTLASPTGAVALGAVDVRESLALNSGASLTLAGATSREGAISLTAADGAALTVSGALAADGDIDLVGGSIGVDAGGVALAIDSARANTGDLRISNGAAALRVDDARAIAGSVVLASGGALTAGDVRAFGGNAELTGASIARVTAASVLAARDNAVVATAGAATLGVVRAGDAVRIDPSTPGVGSLTAASIEAGGDIFIRAANNVSIGTLATRANRLDAALETFAGGAAPPAGIAVDAGDDIAVDTIATTGDLALNAAGSLDIPLAVSAAGGLRLTTGDTFDFNGRTLTAGADIFVGSTGGLVVGTDDGTTTLATTGGNLTLAGELTTEGVVTLEAVGGALRVDDVLNAGTLTLRGRGVAAGTITSPDNPDADGDQAVTVTATAGGVTAGGIGSRGVIVIVATGGATVGDLTALDAIDVAAGGAATVRSADAVGALSLAGDTLALGAAGAATAFTTDAAATLRATAGAVTARGAVTVAANGAVQVLGVGATPGDMVADTLRIDGATILVGGIARQAAGPTFGDGVVRLTADGGVLAGAVAARGAVIASAALGAVAIIGADAGSFVELTAGDALTVGDVFARGGGATLAGATIGKPASGEPFAIAARDDVLFDTPGAVDVDDVRAGGFIDAGTDAAPVASLAAASLRAGQAVTVRSAGGVDVAGRTASEGFRLRADLSDFSDAAAPAGDADVVGAEAVRLGDVHSQRGDVRVASTGGLVRTGLATAPSPAGDGGGVLIDAFGTARVAGFETGGSAIVRGAAVTLTGAGSAGGDVLLAARAGDIIATSDGMAGGAGVAIASGADGGGRLILDAAGAITAGDLAAGTIGSRQQALVRLGAGATLTLSDVAAVSLSDATLTGDALPANYAASTPGLLSTGGATALGQLTVDVAEQRVVVGGGDATVAGIDNAGGGVGIDVADGGLVVGRDGAAALIRATGDVRLRASRTLAGRGALSVVSDSDGIGGGDVALAGGDAAPPAGERSIDFAATTSIAAGADRSGDVFVVQGGAADGLRFGAVAARGFVGSTDGATAAADGRLATTGAFDIASASTREGLNLSGGSLTLGTVGSPGTAEVLGRRADRTPGLTGAGDDLRLASTAGALTVGTARNFSDLAGSATVLSATGGALTLSALAAAFNDLALSSTAAIGGGGAYRAGGTLRLSAARLELGTVRAGVRIEIAASAGDATVIDAAVAGRRLDASLAEFTGAAVTAAGIEATASGLASIATGDAAAGGDLIAQGGSASIGSGVAAGQVRASAGGGAASIGLGEGASVLAESIGGAAAIGAARASAGGVRAASDGGAARIDDAEAIGGDVSASGTSALVTRGVAVGGNVEALAAAGEARIDSARASRDVRASSAGGVLLGDAAAGRNIVASGGDIDASGAMTAGGDILLTARGAARAAGATLVAGDRLLASAGAGIALGAAQAGGDLAANAGLAGGDAVMLTAAGEVRAGGNLALVNANGALDARGALLFATGARPGGAAALRPDGATIVDPNGAGVINRLSGRDLVLAASGDLLLPTAGPVAAGNLFAMAGGRLSGAVDLSTGGSLLLMGDAVMLAGALNAAGDAVLVARDGGIEVAGAIAAAGTEAGFATLTDLSGDAIALPGEAALGRTGGGGVLAAATGALTLPADILAANRLTLLGRGGVALGATGAGTVQRAAGDVLVEASLDAAPASIALADGMLLASNSDGAGAGGDLVLRLGNGDLAAADATLRAGRSAAETLAAQGVVRVAAARPGGGGAVRIGALDGASAALAGSGDVSVAQAAVDAGLSLTSTGGSANLGTVTVGAAVPAMTAAERAAVDVSVAGAAAATLSRTVLAGGAIRNIMVTGGGPTSLGDVNAGNDLTATGASVAIAAGARAGNDMRLRATAGGINARSVALAAGRDLLADAGPSGDLVAGGLSAGRDIRASGGNDLLIDGAITAGGPATLSAGGALRTAAVTTGGNLAAAATRGALSMGALSAAGALDLRAVAGDAMVAAVTRGTNLSLLAGGAAALRGAVGVTGAYTVTASRITLGADGGRQAAGGAVALSSGALTLGGGLTALAAGTTLTLVATAGAADVSIGDGAGAGAGPGSYRLSGADLAKLSAPALQLNAGGLAVNIGDAAFPAIAEAAAFATTGAIRVAGALRFGSTGGAPRVLTLGGNARDASGVLRGRSAEAGAASVRLVTQGAALGRIQAAGSVVRLRGDTIAVGQTGATRQFQEALYTPAALGTDAVRGQFLVNPNSPLYSAVPQFVPLEATLVEAATLVLAPANWALVQNTGVTAQPGGGAAIGALLLQRRGPADPVVALFGEVGGQEGIAAALRVTPDQLDGISPDNVRINGCVALSTAGCILSGVTLTSFQLADPGRGLLISNAPELVLSVELISGATNEALWRDIDVEATTRPEEEADEEKRRAAGGQPRPPGAERTQGGSGETVRTGAQR